MDLSITINKGSRNTKLRTGRRRPAGLTAAAIAAAALVFLLSGCGGIPGNPAETSAETPAAAETPDTPPDWVTWQEKTETADLDGDGTAETLTLEGRSFTARRGDALLFETPEELRKYILRKER